MPVLLVDNGKADEKNAKIAGVTVQSVKDFAEKQGVKLKNVLVMTVDGNGRVYFQPKGKPYKILNMQVSGQW